MNWSSQKKKRGHFLYHLFYLFQHFYLYFISVYSVLNRFSEYTYFYTSKNITLYTFLLVFKIVKSLQWIFKIQRQFICCKPPSKFFQFFIYYKNNVFTSWNEEKIFVSLANIIRSKVFDGFGGSVTYIRNMNT